MTIRIEINKININNKKPWKIRIGDISGSSTETNISKKRVLEIIDEEMEFLRN